MRMSKSDRAFASLGLGLGGAGVIFLIASVCAWCTHVIWIIAKLAGDKGATVGQMVLGAIGAFMPPIGVIHGFMIWLGIGF